MKSNRSMFVACSVLAASFLASVSGTATAAPGNGVAAIDVLGQYDPNTPDGRLVRSFDRRAGNGSVNDFGLWLVYDNVVDTVNHRMFVADYNNNRVVVYEMDSGNNLLDHKADYVLGQPDLFSSEPALTQTGMTGPWGLGWDPGNSRLFVTEADNSRVLVYDLSSGITNGMPASYVLGQPDFTSGYSALNDSTLSWPTDAEWDEDNLRLFVTDNGNSRVLVYDLSSGITNGMAASNVLGQPDFTHWDWTTTAYGFQSPDGTYWDRENSRLFVADFWNHRVLAFDLSSGITNGMAASHVLGQPDFNTSIADTTSEGMSNPTGLAYDPARYRLFVNDSYNHRVLAFDLSSGITNGMAASNVLGQPDFTSSGYGTSSTQMYYPTGALSWDEANERLWVSDGGGNSRVLAFDLSSGITDGMAASDVIGQPASVSDTFPPVASGIDFNSGKANGGPFEFASFVWPQGTVFDEANNRLFVSDGNSRAVVFDTDDYGRPTSFHPSHVLGHADVTSTGEGLSGSEMSSPTHMAWDAIGSRLFLVDQTNHRVLVFDLSGGITDGMAANHVLGQQDLTSSEPGTSSTAMYYPCGVAWDSGNSRLFVSDSFNYRVLVFDLSGGITDGMAASHVLGQPNFLTRTPATSQTGLRYVMGIDWDSENSRLFVADNWSQRVVAFDLSGGITDGMAASHVLGQPNFTSRSTATTPAGLSVPRDVTWDSANRRLFVVDAGNHRVVSYDLSSGIADGMPASRVLGQPDFTSSGFSVSATGMFYPVSATYVAGINRLVVADSSNQRILTFDVSPEPKPVSVTGGSLLSATLNDDGSSTYEIFAYEVGGIYRVTLSSGVAPLIGEDAINVFVNGNGSNKLGVELEADMTLGYVQKVTMDISPREYICVMGEPATRFVFTRCNPKFRVDIPDPGESVEFKPGHVISVDEIGETLSIIVL